MIGSSNNHSSVFLCIVLAAAVVAGGMMLSVARAYKDELNATTKVNEQAPVMLQNVLYGVQGILIVKESEAWRVRVTAPPERAGDEVVVRPGEDAEFLQTVIKSKLLKSPDGALDPSGLIQVRPARVADFQLNDTVYAVANENIDGKDDFEVFRIYRIIYE